MAGKGNVSAAFDEITGAPIVLWFDPMPNAIDDESTWTIEVVAL